MNLKFTRKMFICCFLFLFILGIGSAQQVGVGAGGYTTSGYTPVTGSRMVTDSFNQPMQTNDWWSSLIWEFKDVTHSKAFFPHPLGLMAQSGGLDVAYTDKYVIDTTGKTHHYGLTADFTIGTPGLNVSRTDAASYSDWAVTAQWGDALQATVGHGSPFIYVTKLSGSEISLNFPGGVPVIWSNSNGVIGLTVNNHHYGLFAPTGSSWTGQATMTSELNGKEYLSIALLPDASEATLEYYRKRAYSHVTDTRVSWSYNENTANVTSTFTTTVSQKESGNGLLNETLTALYRHQWLNSDDVNTNYTYVSARGEMKVVSGLSFSTNIKFTGIIPAMPDEGSYDRDTLYGYVNEMYLVDDIWGMAFEGRVDTYWQGKQMAMVAQLIHIADQVGHTAARDRFLNILKARLEDWFTVGGEEEFYYNSEWDYICGFPTMYFADSEMNDHDFHWGYFIQSAAVIAQYDPAWASDSQWGGMVKLLIKDAANGDRNDTRFPFLRSFDAYAGHSWANGPAVFHRGNNEESSSEGMNFISGVFLFASVTGDTEMRDRAIFMYANFVEAIEQYWFDMDNEVYPDDFDYPAVGIVWGNGGANTTWFGEDPEWIYGINMLPFTGGSLYLGHRPEYVQSLYDTLIEANKGPATSWPDIIWNYLAFADPGKALDFFGTGSYSVFAGESKAHTYHWLHNLNAMGNVDEAVTADVPAYAVFNKNGVKTYVAYNPGSTARTVRFSDGAALLVPSRSMASGDGTGGGDDWGLTISPPHFTTGSGIYEAGDLVDISFYGVNFQKWVGDTQYLADPNSANTSLVMPEANVSLTAEYESVEYTVNVGPAVLTTGSGDYEVGRVVNIKFTGINFEKWTGDTQYLDDPNSVSATFTMPAAHINLTAVYGSQVNSVPLPGRIEAEDYDEFYDLTEGNDGEAYRNDDVDIQECEEGGYNVAWIDAGEWLDYYVKSENGGVFSVDVRVASQSAQGALRIYMDGIDVSGLITFTTSNGWQAWKTVTVNGIGVTAGDHVMRIAFESSLININYVEFKSSEDTQPPTVNITSPSNGSQLKRGDQITIQAAAADAEGGIAKVDFYVRPTNSDAVATLIGTDTAAPYEVNWTAAGDQMDLIAIAADLAGNTGSSTIGVSVKDILEEKWVPFYNNQATINSVNANSADITLHFGSAGFRVVDWGNMSISGNNLSVDIKVETWTGPHATVLTDLSNKYNFSPLADGFYTLTVKTWGQAVETTTFTVGSVGGHLIPGRIEAQDYSDMYGIVFEDCSEGGKNAGYIDAGDWLDYEVFVAEAGEYTVKFRVASDTGNGALRLESNGSNLGATNVPYTGNWQGWTDVSTTVQLEAGPQTLRLYATGYEFNVNWFEFTLKNGNQGTGHPVPGRIEAEDYTTMFGIEFEDCSEGGKNAGWIDAGDWLDYKVSVAKAGKYTVKFRVASDTSNGALRLENNGSSLAAISVPYTGSWQGWRDVSATVEFEAGEQTFRLYATGYEFNVNWFEFTSNSGSGGTGGTGGTGTPSDVVVQGRQILVDGEPFHIKGVCWNPVPQGGSHPFDIDYAGYAEQDGALMQAAGINAVRTYEPITDRAVLDTLYAKGIYVINTVYCNIATDLAVVTGAVNAVKDHPAILMWSLGNEWNYNQLYASQSGMYLNHDQAMNKLNEVAALIKGLDSKHPIVTSYGHIPTKSVIDAMPNVDVWGLNMYSGLHLNDVFSVWSGLTTKPFFVSEYGADAWNSNVNGVDEAAQAHATKVLTGLIMDNSSAADANNTCAGGTIFEWSDEWWKAGNPNSHDAGGVAPGGGPHPDYTFNEEYWGIVKVDRSVRPAYYELQAIFNK